VGGGGLLCGGTVRREMSSESPDTSNNAPTVNINVGDMVIRRTDYDAAYGDIGYVQSSQNLPHGRIRVQWGEPNAGSASTEVVDLTSGDFRVIPVMGNTPDGTQSSSNSGSAYTTGSDGSVMSPFSPEQGKFKNSQEEKEDTKEAEKEAVGLSEEEVESKIVDIIYNCILHNFILPNDNDIDKLVKLVELITYKLKAEADPISTAIYDHIKTLSEEDGFNYRFWGDYSNDNKIFSVLDSIETSTRQRNLRSATDTNTNAFDNIKRISQRVFLIIKEELSHVQRVETAGSVFNEDQRTQLWEHVITLANSQDERIPLIRDVGGTMCHMVDSAVNDTGHDNLASRHGCSDRFVTEVNTMMRDCANNIKISLRQDHADVNFTTFAKEIEILTNKTHVEGESINHSINYLKSSGVSQTPLLPSAMCTKMDEVFNSHRFTSNSLGVRTRKICNSERHPSYYLWSSCDAGISFSGAKEGLIFLANIIYRMVDGSFQITQRFIGKDKYGNMSKITSGNANDITEIFIENTITIFNKDNIRIGTATNEISYLTKDDDGNVKFTGDSLTAFKAANGVWLQELSKYTDVDDGSPISHGDIFLKVLLEKWAGDAFINYLNLVGTEAAGFKSDGTQCDVIYCSSLTNEAAGRNTIVISNSANHLVSAFNNALHGANDQLTIQQGMLFKLWRYYPKRRTSLLLTCSDGVKICMTGDGINIPELLMAWGYNVSEGCAILKDGGNDPLLTNKRSKGSNLNKHGLTDSQEEKYVHHNVKNNTDQTHAVEQELLSEYAHSTDNQEVVSAMKSPWTKSGKGGTRRKRRQPKSKRTRRVSKSKRKSKRTRRVRKPSRRSKTRRRVK